MLFIQINKKDTSGMTAALCILITSSANEENLHCFLHCTLSATFYAQQIHQLNPQTVQSKKCSANCLNVSYKQEEVSKVPNVEAWAP